MMPGEEAGGAEYVEPGAGAGVIGVVEGKPPGDSDGGESAAGPRIRVGGGGTRGVPMVEGVVIVGAGTPGMVGET